MQRPDLPRSGARVRCGSAEGTFAGTYDGLAVLAIAGGLVLVNPEDMEVIG